MNCNGNCPGGHQNRRDFLRVGALSGLGITLSQYLELQAMAATTKPKAQACSLLWLTGGPGPVDTWAPNPTSNFKPNSSAPSTIRCLSRTPTGAGPTPPN